MNTTTLNITTLCEKVAKEFKGINLTDSFEKLAKEWIYTRRKIISYKVNTKEYNVIVVIENINGNIDEPSTYDVLRFFPGTTKWQVSCDLQDGDSSQLASKLLNVTEEDF
jgi:hypothetical protein